MPLVLSVHLRRFDMSSQRKKDLVTYPIQDQVRLEVYWRDDEGGHGPASSLYVLEEEVFRFDCWALLFCKDFIQSLDFQEVLIVCIRVW